MSPTRRGRRGSRLTDLPPTDPRISSRACPLLAPQPGGHSAHAQSAAVRARVPCFAGRGNVEAANRRAPSVNSAGRGAAAAAAPAGSALTPARTFPPLPPHPPGPAAGDAPCAWRQSRARCGHGTSFRLPMPGPCRSSPPCASQEDGSFLPPPHPSEGSFPALSPAPASAGSAGSALKRLVLVPGTPSPTCSGEHALSASARASSPHSSLRSAGPRAPAFSRLEPDPAASPATPWRPDPRSAFWPSVSLTAQQLSAPPTSASAFLREGSRACGPPPAPLSSGLWPMVAS